MKLKLTIRLGNAGMESSTHVRHALIAVTNRMNHLGETPSLDDEGRIYDENGNVVGRWRFMRSRKGEKE